MARQVMNGETGFIRKEVEEVFPELKESEDERIRKKIINYFECQSKEEPSRKATHNKWITWLEKIIIPSHNDIDSSFIEDIKGVIAEAPLLMQSDKEKMIAWLEKQGEKPTDEEMKEALRTEYEKGRADAIAEIQKSAWSEEEDAMLNFIALILRNHQSDEDFTTFETTFKDCIDWFKNLKDRVQSQNI